MDLDELDDLASFESADDTDSKGDDPGRKGGHGSGAKGQTLALRATQHLAKQPLQRTGADLDQLLEWVLSVRFFRDNARSSFMRREICRCLRLQRAAAGAVICNQGDPGDAFFVIITGSIKITVDGVEMPPLLTKSGTGLGERALAEESVRSNIQRSRCASSLYAGFTQGARTATMTAQIPSVLARLDAEDYRRLIKSDGLGLGPMGHVDDDQQAGIDTLKQKVEEAVRLSQPPTSVTSQSQPELELEPQPEPEPEPEPQLELQPEPEPQPPVRALQRFKAVSKRECFFFCIFSTWQTCVDGWSTPCRGSGGCQGITCHEGVC